MGSKDCLIKNLGSYYEENLEARKVGYQIYDAMPISFMFDEKMEELENFKNAFYDFKNTRML
mgnify:CR=1 FL=1